MASVLVSGASGLVGERLLPLLEARGYNAARLVREYSAVSQEDVFWDPAAGELDSDALEGVEAVVHLAGENIAAGRWNAVRKERIRESRVAGTKLLCSKLAEMPHPPKVLVCASAIGYYGDRADESLPEDAPAGEGFLPDVCREWEAASSAAEHAGIRVVRLRIGVVLSPKGGALKKMLLPFKLGAGGKMGSGRQYMSWISIDDLTRVILHCIESDALSGAVNAVTPAPVTNQEFTKTLGRVLVRPTLFPLPPFAARLALGEMADALLLASAKVEPAVLKASGFEFAHSDLEEALRHLLGK
jgi:uncharacterized protein (TIGR01777 family)